MSGWGRGKRRIERLHGGMGMLLQSLRNEPNQSEPSTGQSVNSGKGNVIAENQDEISTGNERRDNSSDNEINSNSDSKRIKQEMIAATDTLQPSTSDHGQPEPYAKSFNYPSDYDSGKIESFRTSPENPGNNSKKDIVQSEVIEISTEKISENSEENPQINSVQSETEQNASEAFPEPTSSKSSIFFSNKLPTECFKWDAPEPSAVSGHKKWVGVNRRNNFFKGCKWSPNGDLLVTNSEDRKLRFFTLQSDGSEKGGELMLSNSVQEGDLVYDFAWHPSPGQSGPLLATTTRSQPVLLRSASTGQIEATFRPHNHLDELSSAHSLCFSTTGDRLYLGFNKIIKIFDSTRPGKLCTAINTTNKLLGGQSGIISCLSASLDGRSFVAGSYGRTIGMYSEGVGDVVMAFHAHSGGITSIAYSPDGRYIYSGGRKDPEIRCWDTRNVTDLLCIYERCIDTNQRIHFDIDSGQNFLVSGTSDGEVKAWDLKNLPQTPSEYGMSVQSTLTFRAHGSCTNGASLHPERPLLATTSGQRVFPSPNLGSESEDSSSPEDYERRVTLPSDLDNSLKLWSLEKAHSPERVV